ncbi:hypothetical protein ACE1CD_14805 [Aerosakkonema sp. BLCC-F183]|uniref:hypothetical protein n=1 Tax=Aerosakkonema sp. BLCC-F183 TaxID=3342834 RepID=UPI0035B81228
MKCLKNLVVTAKRQFNRYSLGLQNVKSDRLAGSEGKESDRASLGKLVGGARSLPSCLDVDEVLRG